jgi:hypothetical protein
MKLTLKAEGLATRLRGKMVDIYDFPDGRLEVRWKGRPLPYSVFDKLQRVSHAAIVENKRLGEILAWIKEQQDRQPRLSKVPKGPRRSSQASGLLKNRAMRMAEVTKSNSKAPHHAGTAPIWWSPRRRLTLPAMPLSDIRHNLTQSERISGTGKMCVTSRRWTVADLSPLGRPWQRFKAGTEMRQAA